VNPEEPEKTVRLDAERTHMMMERRVRTLGDAAPSAPLKAGSTIKGRFLLKEEIGHGGMGIVFSAIDRRKTEARDPNPLVAIKILNEEVAKHPAAFMTLQREARKSQTLAHPNVATVFDFDRDGERVFMSMELLHGQPLDVLLRDVNRPVMSKEQAMPIIKGVGEGLAYAHRKGIVHSDLKPANIFLTDEGTTKILDFGIARAVPSTNVLAGPKDLYEAKAPRAYTEAYATAEMVAGEDPHPADDVYALGLIAYQLFTGFHPYQQCSVPKAREAGFKATAPMMLTRREWRVLERSLSFNREDRPRDAAEFLAQFAGVTPRQKAWIAASVVLALVAAFVSYQRYEEAGPSVAFEQLPAQTQQEFKAFMHDGDRLWQFYDKEHNLLALQEAVDQYAQAYELHPRNRQAVGALKRAADAALEATRDQPQQQREFARALAQRSGYLAAYPPIAVINRRP
jgi:predicted Ser/Thr protein kinase